MQGIRVNERREEGIKEFTLDDLKKRVKELSEELFNTRQTAGSSLMPGKIREAQKLS